jgi:26 proteasome complex subunit DSS1
LQQIYTYIDSLNNNNITMASTGKTPTPPPTVVEAIEEDDEFEEFEPAHWAAGEEVSEDTQQWQDNWDADDMDDDFTKNLREELSKNSGK